MEELAEALEQFRSGGLDHSFPWPCGRRLLHELLARRVVRGVIVIRRRWLRLRQKYAKSTITEEKRKGCEREAEEERKAFYSTEGTE